MVGAGLYESKEEAAKGEEVLLRIRQARVFFKKIIIGDFETWDDLAVIFFSSIGSSLFCNWVMN